MAKRGRYGKYGDHKRLERLKQKRYTRKADLDRKKRKEAGKKDRFPRSEWTCI